MYDQPPRRKARAIAISETIEMRRKALVMKVMAVLGLVLAASEAVWVMHHVIAASR